MVSAHLQLILFCSGAATRTPASSTDLMDEGIHDRLTIATTSVQVSVPSC